jgi:KaiC/GvpD/RAD55 family RecA-like ATPase
MFSELKQLGAREFIRLESTGRCALVVMSALLILASAGCSGCRLRSAEKPAEKKEVEKPKVPFEQLETRTLPTDDQSLAISAKPGHWVELTHAFRANNSQFVGELALQPLTDESRHANLERSPFSVTSTRPAVLPRGQRRQFESVCFLPRLPASDKCRFQTELRQRATRRSVMLASSHLGPALPSSTYFFLVLAENPDDYGYLSRLASISPPQNAWEYQSVRSTDYIVVAPSLHNELRIPSSLSTWTSTAYVLWDSVLPDTLTSAQQIAMVDWLHWGGQLIIAGQNSLDLLRGSFLGEYLPAEYVETTTVHSDELTQFNEKWSPKRTEASQNELRRILGASSPEGISLARLSPVEDADFVPDAEQFVVERRVGRGRVCCVSMPLSDPTIVNWEGFDGFFNACILRRPGRKFDVSDDGSISVKWREFPDFSPDARINCGLRFFTRDFASLKRDGTDQSAANSPQATIPATPARVEPAVPATPGDRQQPSDLPDSGAPDEGSENSDDDDDSFWKIDYRPVGAYMNDAYSGVAGWNDFSDVSSAARQALKGAAGVQIPDRRFVAKVLAVYLLCLVPINWLLFRLVGKLEFAWIAAPLIAVVGAVAVVKLAQLDVGFVRSRTELAILETQPGYLRAHLTRFCGVYTSLSTSYGLEYDDAASVALPFSTNPSDIQLRNQQQHVVNAVRGTYHLLRRFPVISNSTGMVHSEEMRELPGPIRLTDDPRRRGQRIENLTGLDWIGALLIGRREDGVYAAYLGTLEDQERRAIELQLAGEAPFPEQEIMAALLEGSFDIRIESVWKLAVSPQSLAVGQWRLVAWREGILEGVAIRPRSSQENARNLLIAHLHYGDFPEPRGDANRLPTGLDDLYDDQQDEIEDQ